MYIPRKGGATLQMISEVNKEQARILNALSQKCPLYNAFELLRQYNNII
jgi:hypothetical protein